MPARPGSRAALKQTRKFGFPKLYSLRTDLVSCRRCNEVHSVRSVCGTCYAADKKQTDQLKQQVLGLRPRP